MKVKVGNKVTSGELEPIMVILSEQDKKLIKDMPSDIARYCEYPRDSYTPEEITKWMQEDSLIKSNGVAIKEGTVKKGGRNKAPSIQRPSEPPKGQGGRG